MHFGEADCDKRELGRTVMAGFGTSDVDLIFFFFLVGL
jgi:hypothetical protein